MEAEYIPIFRKDSPEYSGKCIAKTELNSNPVDCALVHVMVYTDFDRVVLSRRAKHKFFGGTYLTSAAGHLGLKNSTPEIDLSASVLIDVDERYVETSQEAGVRELREELDTDNAELVPIGDWIYYQPDYPDYAGGNRWIRAFRTDKSENLNPNIEEIEIIGEFSIEELVEMALEEKSDIHPELRFLVINGFFEVID